MPNNRKVEIELDRIRRDSGAQLVLVIKADWGFVSADAGLSSVEAAQLLREEAPRVQAFLKEKRGF